MECDNDGEDILVEVDVGVEESVGDKVNDVECEGILRVGVAISEIVLESLVSVVDELCVDVGEPLGDGVDDSDRDCEGILRVGVAAIETVAEPVVVVDAVAVVVGEPEGDGVCETVAELVIEGLAVSVGVLVVVPPVTDGVLERRVIDHVMEGDRREPLVDIVFDHDAELDTVDETVSEGDRVALRDDVCLVSVEEWLNDCVVDAEVVSE